MAHRSLTQHLKPHERLILAYDLSEFHLDQRLLLSMVGPYIGMVKLGYQSITAPVPGSTVAATMINYLDEKNIPYFYDGKFKDIKNTVEQAVRNLCASLMPTPRIFTIHATMRVETIIAALETAKKSPTTLVAGVSFLTDHEDADAMDIYGKSAEEVVINCADRLLHASKETGVPAAMVCAPPDLLALQNGGSYDKIVKITPGIRAKDAPPDDQKRTMTAAEAIRAGADYLVIGRPIMRAPDPVLAAKTIAVDIASAL